MNRLKSILVGVDLPSSDLIVAEDLSTATNATIALLLLVDCEKALSRRFAIVQRVAPNIGSRSKALLRK